MPTAIIAGEAAMVANGPWMVATDIKGAKAAKDLYGEIGNSSSAGRREPHGRG